MRRTCLYFAVGCDGIREEHARVARMIAPCVARMQCAAPVDPRDRRRRGATRDGHWGCPIPSPAARSTSPWSWSALISHSSREASFGAPCSESQPPARGSLSWWGRGRADLPGHEEVVQVVGVLLSCARMSSSMRRVVGVAWSPAGSGSTRDSSGWRCARQRGPRRIILTRSSPSRYYRGAAVR